MSLAWVIRSKLVPPDPPAAWLRRELTPTIGAPAIVALVAGAGYGKTLGLRALYDEGPPDALRVWYGLDGDDADPATFFSHLAAGLQAHAPQFGEELLALVGAGKHDAKLLWQRFFQSIAAYDPPAFVLALDDVHHLAEGQQEVLSGLASWLGKLPPRVRVLMASRRKLPMPLARLQLQGLAVTVGPERLRFGDDEVAEFLRKRAGHERLPEAWRQQLEALEGWPLGLELLAAGHELPTTGGQVDLLADYIAEELLASQPAARRDLMLRAALLHEPTLDTLASVLDLPMETVRAELEALEADQLVIRLTRASHGARVGEAGVERWRFPAFLAEWLRREAARRVAPDAASALHGRAARLLLDAELPEAALPHLVAAQDWQAAIAACAAAFPLMSVYGRKASIQRAIASFPPAVREREPFLQLWIGNGHARALRFVEAAETFERARQLWAARGDAAGELKVLVRQATMALWAGDQEAFAARLAECEARLSVGSPEDVIDYRLSKALAAETAGDEDGMRAENEAALAVPTGTNPEAAQGMVLALINLHTWALHRGRLEEAARHADEAIRLAEEWRFFAPLRLATLLRAHLGLLTGDPAGAAAIDALPPFWEDPLSWSELAVALTIVGYREQLRGDWKRADDALRRATDLFARAGFREGMLVPMERRLWGTVMRDQPGRAAELLAEFGELGTKSLHELAPRVPLARALQLAGDPAAAIAAIEPALAGFATLEADLHLARAHMVAAAVRHAAGDTPAARADLARADDLIERHGFAFLRAHDARLQAELAAIAVADAPAPAIAGAAPAPAPATKPGRAKAPREEAPASTATLRIRAFGAMEVVREGVVLDHWPRRKSKLVLAALLLRPRGIDAYDLAELIEDGEPDAGSLHALQMAVSALRRVLEPELEGKREASRFVSYRDDRYTLSWDFIEEFDLRAFDQAMDLGDAEKPRDPNAARAAYERAIALVGGPLFADSIFTGRFDAEREHYRRRAMVAMLWVGDQLGSLMRRDQAEAMYAKAIALAPCEEEAYLALMRHHRACGRPERVRQAYWDCRKALKAKLGTAPSEEFEKAFRDLEGR